jgi:L-alanine-DL-glutamate epimerase-like enolase superfamily enzyme
MITTRSSWEDRVRFSRPMDSIRFGQRIAHTRPFAMEEVADAEDAGAAREVGVQTGIAIAGGERLSTLGDFRRFSEARALSLAQPDMGIAGGFTGVRAIAALAREPVPASVTRA